MALYRVWSKIDETIDSIQGWDKKVTGTILCPTCNCIRKEWFPKPVDVPLEDYPSRRIFDLVGWTPINIYHVDFIEQISQYMDNCIFGKCYLEDGSEVKEYITCYVMEDWIVIRGDKKTRYRECTECGAVNSISFIANEYTLQCYLKKDKQVYQDRYNFVYIDEDLAAKLDFSPWPDTELQPIAVRDTPLDNRKLMCDPPNAPWGSGHEK